VGTQVQAVPTVGGTATGWSVSPALPAGLTLSYTTGTISGVAFESIAPTDYTVTAYNGTAQASTHLSISITTTMPAPAAASYTTFDGTPLTLYAWEGRNLAILSRNPSLNPGTMQLWVAALDRGWDFAASMTGRQPTAYSPTQYNGKSTIADVPSTCGAGCSYLGTTGTEVANSYFDATYASAHDKGLYGSFLFYEFGRTFWFYDSKVDYKDPNPSDAVVTGYAVLMQWWAMEGAGVQEDVSTCDGFDHNTELAHVAGLIDVYLANTSLTWSNTLATNSPVLQGCADDAPVLFASFLMRARRDYGGTGFVGNVWKQVDARPDAVTTQDAVDNLVLAASAASNANLTQVFNVNWRWPVSDAAKAEALSRWGQPR